VPKTPAPPVAAKAAAAKTAAKGPSGAKGQPPAMTKWLAIGGAAVLVLVLGVVIMRFARTTPAPVNTTGPQVEAMLTDARRLIDQGDCAGALARGIDPALSLDPGNADAQTLKARATACTPAPVTTVPPTASAMTPEEVAAHLQAATEALGRKECEPATSEINKVLDVDASNQQALELKVKADACAATPKPPVPPPPPAQKLAVRIAPENGGLEPTSGELDKDYQPRVKAMRTRYDEAISALAKESSPRVIAMLDGIAREAGPKYLDVTPKLTDARKTLAAQLVNEARELDAKNDYDQAIGRFQRAALLDHDAKLDEDIRRVQEKKRQAGLKACDEAKNAYAFNRGQQALEFYQQVIKLLPESDPCFATAKERIATLSR
jgi:tetratricopeptide (TPR) repeat protein